MSKPSIAGERLDDDISSNDPTRSIERAKARAAEIASLHGMLDAIRDGVLFGCAWNSSDPPSKPEVEIFVDGSCTGIAVANQHRKALETMGIGDGFHAFSFQLPDNAEPTNIAAFFKNTRRSLQLGPFWPANHPAASSASTLSPVSDEAESAQAGSSATISQPADAGLDDLDTEIGRLADLGMRLGQVESRLTSLASGIGATGKGMERIHERAEKLAAYNDLVTLQKSLLPTMNESHELLKSAEEATTRIEGFLHVDLGQWAQKTFKIAEFDQSIRDIRTRARRSNLLLILLLLGLLAELVVSVIPHVS